MPQFHNRDTIMHEMLKGKSHLLSISGEVGIGKTRLLEEAERRIRANQPHAVVARVDFKALADLPEPENALLRKLVEAATREDKRVLQGIWESKEQVARQISAQLNALAQVASIPVFLFFDSTDVFQENKSFWPWLEHNLLSPLVVENQVRVVLAGRVAAPLYRLEVRRAIHRQILGPLDGDTAIVLAEELLVEKALAADKPQLSAADKALAAKLIFDLSLGHPLLIEMLAGDIIEHWRTPLPPDIEIALCRDTIQPFVSKELLSGLDPFLQEMLPYLTILRWFDATILKEFLLRLNADAAEKPDYFFAQIIAELRKRDRADWKAGIGFQTTGVMRDIMQRCMQTEAHNHDRYHEACRAAAAAFHEIAEDFRERGEGEQAEPYESEAQYYLDRIQNLQEARGE